MSIQWNLSNPDTFGTILHVGVHFMEGSSFQGLINMQIQHFETTISVLNNYGSVLISGVQISEVLLYMYMYTTMPTYVPTHMHIVPLIFFVYFANYLINHQLLLQELFICFTTLLLLNKK